MMAKLLATIQLSLVVFALVNSSGATNSSEYIDLTSFENNHKAAKPGQIEMVKLVEDYGSDNPAKTAEFVAKIEQVLGNMNDANFFGSRDVRERVKKEAEQYDLHNRIPSGGLVYFRKVAQLFRLITEREVCNTEVLDNYLQTIALTFGDLDSFVNEKPNSNTKLHAFLTHYGKQFVEFCLDRPQYSKFYDSYSEQFMDKLVSTVGQVEAHDGGRERKLLSTAREFDFLTSKFSAYKMIDVLRQKALRDPFRRRNILPNLLHNSGKPYMALHFKLRRACSDIDGSYGLILKLYNLACLLIPDKAAELFPNLSRLEPDRFQKLNEYSRICIPVINPSLKNALIKGIKRNKPQGSIKDVIRNNIAYPDAFVRL